MKRIDPNDLRKALPEGISLTCESAPHSYRGGALWIIYPSDMDICEDEFSFEEVKDLECFEPTGYDGRGRKGLIVKFRRPKDGEKPYVMGKNTDLDPEVEGCVCLIGNSEPVYVLPAGEKEKQQKELINNIFADLL